MKRMLCIVLCAMMVVSLFAGCSNPQDASTPASSAILCGTQAWVRKFWPFALEK